MAFLALVSVKTIKTVLGRIVLGFCVRLGSVGAYKPAPARAFPGFIAKQPCAQPATDRVRRATISLRELLGCQIFVIGHEISLRGLHVMTQVGRLYLERQSTERGTKCPSRPLAERSP